eukprot:988527-Pleurochrysis_carterae.AAC.1
MGTRQPWWLARPVGSLARECAQPPLALCRGAPPPRPLLERASLSAHRPPPPPSQPPPSPPPSAPPRPRAPRRRTSCARAAQSQRACAAPPGPTQRLYARHQKRPLDGPRLLQRRNDGGSTQGARGRFVSISKNLTRTGEGSARK